VGTGLYFFASLFVESLAVFKMISLLKRAKHFQHEILYVPPHLRYVAAVPCEVLEIHFHAVLQKMLSVSHVFKIECFMPCG